jgi:hypothetical protein
LNGYRFNNTQGNVSAAGVNLFRMTAGFTNWATFNLDIFQPQNSSFKTTFLGSGLGDDGTFAVGYANAGFFDATTSFDSATIFPDSNNITGNVSVYGYNK